MSKSNSVFQSVIGILFVLASSIAFSQTKSESPGLQNQQAQQIDQLLKRYAEYGQFNGSALVAEQGKTRYKNGFGLANMEWEIPNAANTKHRLGSITKQFTAMLILQMAEQGKLTRRADYRLRSRLSEGQRRPDHDPSFAHAYFGHTQLYRLPKFL